MAGYPDSPSGISGVLRRALDALSKRIATLETTPAASALDDLTDVNAPAPTNGQVLTWDSTPGEWVSAAAAGGVTDHGALTGLADDDHTQYLNTTRHDTHDHTAALGAASVTDLADVNTTGVAASDVLTWDGSGWVPNDIGSIVSAGDSLDVQIFTATGADTWTKPAGAVMVEVHCIGGGGGGGSGSTSTTLTNRTGGSGGGGGGHNTMMFNASDLSATEDLYVGAGGTGGAATTANNSSGTDGTDGGDSWFGHTTVASAKVWAANGLKGLAGIGGTSARAGGAGGTRGPGIGPTVVSDGNKGGSSPAAGGGDALKGGPGGGGGGAGVSSSSTTGADGGRGGPGTYGGKVATDNTASGGSYGGALGGTAGGSGGGAGGNGGNGLGGVGVICLGGGGGGGGSPRSNAEDGGDGGDGAAYGGGGGGGGCGGTAGVPVSPYGGAGGNGADGAVIVITHIDTASAAAQSFSICTSGTRPASPVRGQMIYETDTGDTLHYYGATTGWKPPWNVAWGCVTTASSFNSATSGTTKLTTSDTTAYTFIANRDYLVMLELDGGWYGDTAGDIFTVGVETSASVDLFNTAVEVDVAGNYIPPGAMQTLANPTGSVQYHAYAQRSSGAGVLQFRGQVRIYDMGPNGNAPAS